MKTIVIGCDNAAVHMKNELVRYLAERGNPVEDMGCHSEADPTYYPYIARRVCEAIAQSGYQKDGVLICGTGLGMSITANKFRGIRAGVCHDTFSAERLKKSNDGNVLCMGERVLGLELAKKILEEFLRSDFIDGPSTPKVEAIAEIEAGNMK